MEGQTRLDIYVPTIYGLLFCVTDSILLAKNNVPVRTWYCEQVIITYSYPYSYTYSYL